MKKLLTIIPAAALALSAFTAMGVSASAACAGKHGVSSCHTSAARNYGWSFERSSTATVNTQARALHYFIDSNNDGICDNCTDGVCMSNGLCSSYFHEHGVFIDNNNDGICDNYAAGVCTQHGNHHMGGNFIDNNNDGICDNCTAGVCSQHGVGLSHHNGHGCHR